ncbi:MAG: hypothetical protein GF317_08085 [Candidatus Lokiarchaeota archaeon]|nr:hypothetical protein [Candidatus Lokiarchaeota archaeon]MBD3199672.1 hypothetical protein [Candidatus Lokiarchaeota archaeon]
MLEIFSTWPTKKVLRYLIVFALVLLFIIYPFMMYYYTVSQYPVSFFESQLSFNGELLKSHYSITNIDLYRIAQSLDYGFMVSYGILLFCISLIVARNFEENTLWSKLGFLMPVLGVFAPLLDAAENLFILLMLTDPLGFPNILALLHSFCALFKYIFMLLTLGYIIIATIASKVKK